MVLVLMTSAATRGGISLAPPATWGIGVLTAARGRNLTAECKIGENPRICVCALLFV